MAKAKSQQETANHEMVVKEMQNAGEAAITLAGAQGLMRLLGCELSLPGPAPEAPPVPCEFSWTHAMLAMYQIGGQATNMVRNDVVGRAVKLAQRKNDYQMLLSALECRTALWLAQHEIARVLTIDNMMPTIEALNVLDGEMQQHREVFIKAAITRSKWQATWRERAKHLANLPWWLTPTMEPQLPTEAEEAASLQAAAVAPSEVSSQDAAAPPSQPA